MEEVEPVEVGCDPGDRRNLPGGLADEHVDRVPGVHIASHEQTRRQQLVRVGVPVEPTQVHNP